jgi:hypothetical protein
MTRSAGPTTWSDVAAEAADERKALESRTARFDRLRDAQQGLGMSRTTGDTVAHWRPARQDLDSAGSLLATWGSRLDAVDGLVHAWHGRRNVELARAVEMLRGDTIELAPSDLPTKEHRPPAAQSNPPRFSLDRIKGLVDDRLSAVASMLEEVAAVRETVDRLAALLGASDAYGDLPADMPVPRERVADLVARARLDPMAVAAACTSQLELALWRVHRAQLRSHVNQLQALEIHEREAQQAGGGTTSTLLGTGDLHEELRGMERFRAEEAGAATTALVALGRRIAAVERAVRPVDRRLCARTDCDGGRLDETLICDKCFRGPARGEAD